MMDKLMARAEAVARAAQRRRLEEIAGSFRSRGIQVEAGADSLAVRARGLARRWLGDALLRFAGRGAA